MAANMVGTGIIMVQCSRSIRSRQTSGSNASTTTVRAPSDIRLRSGAIPATWNMAGAARNTSSDRSPTAMVLWNELLTMLAWLSMTPLGLPVVPPV